MSSIYRALLAAYIVTTTTEFFSSGLLFGSILSDINVVLSTKIALYKDSLQEDKVLLRKRKKELEIQRQYLLAYNFTEILLGVLAFCSEAFLSLYQYLIPLILLQFLMKSPIQLQVEFATLKLRRGKNNQKTRQY